MNINIYNPYVRAELELYHHGIQGQKWGKRNGPPYPLGSSAMSSSEKKAKKSVGGRLSGVSDSIKKKRDNVSKKMNERSKKTIKSLSDAELNKRIERMKKENEYARLIGRSPVNDLSRGKKIVNNLLDSVGKMIIVPAAVGATTYVLKSKFNTDFNPEAAKEIFKNVNVKNKKG